MEKILRLIQDKTRTLIVRDSYRVLYTGTVDKFERMKTPLKKCAKRHVTGLLSDYGTIIVTVY